MSEESKVPTEFKMDSKGEFDEVFLENASVHIERMDETGFWIGIDLPDGRCIHVNTGVERGTWFFNVSEAHLLDGKFLSVQRPRKSKPVKALKP